VKKIEENRYPNSATLFRFCKEALEIRYEGNVKVIDQDVGSILGYDPADCSHWKKGKKNIRALSTLRSIADHLSIDERLLIDIASGKIDLEEAIFEYRGYGDFTLQGRNLENLKKEFFKNPAKWQSDGTIKAFEELFDTDRQSVVTVVENVLNAGNFTEAPIYMPEVIQLFPNIKVQNDATITTAIKIERTGEGVNTNTTITLRGDDIRPYIRFLVAKELFRHLCATANPVVGNLANGPQEVIDIQANLFAGILMVPGSFLKKEVEKIDGSYDIISQLADTFWVSKALMNQRLRDYMEHLN
jgi:hypothetical protein